MNIEEMLAKYTKEYEAAYQAYRTLEVEMWAVLYDNEEPFELVYLNGEPTGIKIKTPDDVADIITGCVIAIGGAEWFRADGYWVRTAPAVPKKLWSDLDLVNELINEYEDNDYIATVIDPGLE